MSEDASIRWLKQIHHMHNEAYFYAKLPVATFRMVALKSSGCAEYELGTRKMTFCLTRFKDKMADHALFASDILLKMMVLQHLDFLQVDLTDGDPADNGVYVSEISRISPLLGLPHKSQFSRAERTGWPMALTHSDFYYGGTDRLGQPL